MYDDDDKTIDFLLNLINKENVMKNIQKLLITIATLGVFSSFLIGCNTIHGVGQDVKKSGQAISNVAEDTSNKIASE